MNKTFHVGTALSVVEDKLMPPEGVKNLYAICDFMSGFPNYTHQIPATIRLIAPKILELYPALGSKEIKDIMKTVNAENVTQKLEEIINILGFSEVVLPELNLTPRDPIADAVQMSKK